MAGFKSIAFAAGEEAGTQKVTVVTDGSEEVTKEQAVKSLGDKAEKFVVQTWTKEGAEAEEEKEEKKETS